MDASLRGRKRFGSGRVPYFSSFAEHSGVEFAGSLGMLPSASLGEVDARTKKRSGLYEPVHGSAPDIAGKGVANPIAMVASFAMALRYSLGMTKEADLVEQAIAAALAKGLRTPDIQSEGTTLVGTAQMGEAIVGEMARLATAAA